MRKLAHELLALVLTSGAASAGDFTSGCSLAPSTWVAKNGEDFVIHVGSSKEAYRICQSNFYGYADRFTVYANADASSVALPYKLKGPPEYACADVDGKIVFVSTDRASYKIDGWYCPLR